MTVSVAFWTIASAAHAWATGFWSLAVARASLGFGEGATFPGGLRVATQTLPVELRSRGMALSYSGGSLGAIVTPIIVTPIASRWGWRGAFLFTGLIGVIWLVLWAVVGRREDVRMAPSARDRSGRRPGPGWLDAPLWGFMSAYALGGIPLAFVLYDASLYLNRVMHMSQQQVGNVLWIPPLGWEIGYFGWGWLTDRALKAAPAPRTAYRILFTWCTILSLPFAATPLLSSSAAVMASLFFVMFVASGYIVVSISYATWIYSGDHAGLIAGLGAGSWGAMVALVMPWFGRMFDQAQYSNAFILVSLFPAAGYLLWLILDRAGKSAARG
jgi:ACS family hexuronate transporter-like MFS transporter